MEKQSWIESWKKENWVTEENKDDFEVRIWFTSEWREFTLWKKVSVYKI